MESNMNAGSFDAGAIPPGVILALPAQPEGHGRSGPRQHRRRAPSQPIERAPTQPIERAPVQPGRTVPSDGSNPEGFVTGDFVIKAGEDIPEKIRSYFQDQNYFPSGDHARMGIILSATGYISSPTIRKAGSALFNEGTHCIIRLSGCFLIPKNGPMELPENLQLVFHHSDGYIEGGPVIGGLIAATPVQVVVGCGVQLHQ